MADQQPTPAPAPAPDAPSVLGFLDEHKTLFASALVAAATYFFPPATALLQADPQLAMVVVTGLFSALHLVAKGPGVLRK